MSSEKELNYLLSVNILNFHCMLETQAARIYPLMSHMLYQATCINNPDLYIQIHILKIKMPFSCCKECDSTNYFNASGWPVSNASLIILIYHTLHLHFIFSLIYIATLHFDLYNYVCMKAPELWLFDGHRPEWDLRQVCGHCGQDVSELARIRKPSIMSVNILWHSLLLPPLPLLMSSSVDTQWGNRWFLEVTGLATHINLWSSSQRLATFKINFTNRVGKVQIKTSKQRNKFLLVCKA